MSEQINFIAVTNRRLCKTGFAQRIEFLCESGVSEIILREKDLSEEEYKLLFLKVSEICQRYNVLLAGNKFEQAVFNLGGKGFQYSFDKFTEKSERHFPVEGVSVHSVDEALKAESKGADYLIAGHIFSTDCKKGVTPRGLDFLKKVCESVKIPVYAIGGINDKNAYDCIKAGAYGICKMSGAMV